MDGIEDNIIKLTPEDAIADLNLHIETNKALIAASGGVDCEVFWKRIGTYLLSIEALEKHIPKQPILIKNVDDPFDSGDVCCPTCKKALTDRMPYDNETFYFHCMNCGQAFSWEKKMSEILGIGGG